jgi:sterol 3beta-glucosyltransferase
MASGEEDHKRREVRKIVKRRKPHRICSVLYPERLQQGDDASEDVTAPKGNAPHYMNQSVFSMIAAAGSKADFHAQFDDGSSGSETEPVLPMGHGIKAQRAEPSQDSPGEKQQDVPKKSDQAKDGKKRPESRLRRSLPRLNLRTPKEKNYMSASGILPPRDESSPERPLHRTVTPRDAPVMSRMLEAEARLSTSTTLVDAGPEPSLKSQSSKSSEAQSGKGTTTLVTRLMEIFGFEQPEEVLSGPSDTHPWPSSMLIVCTRVSLLAFTKCSTPRLYVHYRESYLLLCVSSQEICKPLSAVTHDLRWLTPPRM